MTARIPCVFTFSASDPTSGAGLQADVLTVAALGAHPVTVLTGLTAQNTVGVTRVEALSADWVRHQLDTLLVDGLVPCAIKTGVLGSVAAVDAVVALKLAHPNVPLVVDPVRASGRGDGLATDAVWAHLCDALLPVTDLLTPNWPEAVALTGASSVDEAARALLNSGVKAVLLKGEHLNGEQVVNRLYTMASQSDFPCERLPHQYHGSGCTLASACAAGLAQGLAVDDAVAVALEFTWHALRHGFAIGQGQHIPDRMHVMQQLMQDAQAGDDEHVTHQGVGA
ncbi:hydroxymethylpyrimidine/phosphomethylpyrimidine kinase [Limnobacter humi]|uniref:hydroxymethylpyrimidine kinase n=1 Tax=Limnobacter humi TaxID=1778671 RepID=A0ABT1WC69_9BURK|nr:bifunctional hydroxymethylpyrimidine kinase/phosphomethylpyrimidine kinase [Limnobacter humi]MCQ8895100.1 hydroxymethylpyrimidine/phosphomethylpyrimidine kinase [Limnobacter humi]